ncbi:MAG: hypothetical protein H6Q66_862 [Firmicutes bacterium]|nr:hypothetical protein [Bacillota bacterium]
MKNVYDEVQVFYNGEINWEPLIQQDWVEGLLRQKAWQGANDEELRDIWQNLRCFIIYLAHSEHDNLDEITCREYSLVIEWLAGCVPGFQATLKTISHFFEVLLAFYQFLQNKKMLHGIDELERAIRLLTAGKKIDAINSMPLEKKELRFLDNDLNKAFGKTCSNGYVESKQDPQEAIERLMVRLGSYFQQDQFNDDFRRALLLYTGPCDKIPDEEQEEFWLGFWDYFLLDYHLLANDKKALVYFHETNEKNLTSEEQRILNEMLNVRFIVFYVERILNQQWIECVNLFSGEKFQLPCPAIDYKKIKKMIFFGHVFLRDTMLINYVTSVETSLNLRRRIRQEVLRQKAIFMIQYPEASWPDFFNRHSLLVRHTIDMLVTTAKVNVTPFEQMGRDFPSVIETCIPDNHVQKSFSKSMPEYGFSFHDIQLAQKLWHDFSQITEISVRKPDAWAAAILYIYSRINSPHGIPAEELAQDFHTSAASIYNNKTKVYKTLQLKRYDPRYLNEEGFIFLLFSS